MKQPKFNVGDSFETTYLPSGMNHKLIIDGINYSKEEYTFVASDKFSTTATFDWWQLESGVTSGDFILIGDINTQKEEELMTSTYIERYQEQEFHCYNPELDFTRDEGNRYTIDGLDDEELLEVSAWVNTPKDAVNSFLDKMMKEY